MGRHRLNYSIVNDARRLALDGRGRPIPATPEMLLSTEYSKMVGRRIRHLRRGFEWTQAQVLDLVTNPRGGRYSVGLLSRMERGWANPPLYAYIHIAEALGIDPAELMGPRAGDAGESVEVERDPAQPSEAERMLLGALREAGITPEVAVARILSA
jgi:transcriptional regulator with XRE-family HTH domain